MPTDRAAHEQQDVCPFCGGSRFLHSGIQIPASAEECYEKRAVVAMLRPEEIEAGHAIYRDRSDD